METFDTLEVDHIIEKYGSDRSFLISMLHDVQAKYRFLPEDVLRYISHKLDIPLINIYRIATFYKSFSLTPKGKHQIRVCLGTACHVRGGQRILDSLERNLGVKTGETTEDEKFTLERVNCVGCCALGPVVVVDKEYHGNMEVSKVEKVIEKYS
ncbi:MAG: NADH-quinone oxidoreductase subunit NuoE [Actinomycetota bacterium]|nr:NADH-quinone oxidoreductase subunit NuoE [Actinomycetota bacterium]